VSREIKSIKVKNKTIGFVPTMGYLHQGHLSLIHQAKKDCDVSIVSIFVNPTQFGPEEDYKNYPRNLKRDLKLAAGVGVDIVFVPQSEDIYPRNYRTYVNVEKLTDGLCGASRPGHFRGVTTIVTKLFNLVKPNIAYFGRKDAQQARVIEKMAEDLNLDIKIKVMPIVREKDGLALSSRNVYLNKEERKDALVLYEALKLAKKMILSGQGNSKKIILAMKKLIKNVKRAKVDYVSIVDIENLEKVATIKNRVLVALAVWIGKTRLIDNMRISPVRDN
jgi:pantoate--beta-alanine ligase